MAPPQPSAAPPQPPMERTVSDASIGAGMQPVVQPPRAGHKTMMSKVERLLAGVWNSPDRTASRKTLKRAAPDVPAAPLAAGRADVQTQPVVAGGKASSPTLLPSPAGYGCADLLVPRHRLRLYHRHPHRHRYRRAYTNVLPAASRGRSAAHTTYLSTNELYVDRSQ